MTLAIAQASKWLGPKRAEGGDRAPGVDPPAWPVRARFRGRPRASPGKRRVSVTPQSQSAPPGETRRQNAPFRHVAAPGRCRATPRQAAGHYGECLNWADALEQPPAKLRGGLRGGPQISVRSLASRKGALCNPTSRKAALWGCRPHGEVHSVRRTSRKTAFCAPDLTERRTLRVAPHGKAHSMAGAQTECAFP